MALTIHHQPQVISPVYNDLMFVVSTNHTPLDLFKFTVKVYHAGTLLKTLKYDRWPHGPYIQADVHRILESRYNYVIENLASPTASGFKLVPGTFADYKVEFGEEYAGTPIASGAVTASGFYAFNGALKYLDWIDFDNTDYNLATGSQHKFLTNSPRIISIRENETAELGFISTTKKAKNALVTTYDAAGGVIDSHTINNSIYGGSSDSVSQALSFMCGPYNLNLISSIITADVAKYTVVLRDVDDPVSETFTFSMDRECGRHQLFRLHFLNRWGRFDSFTFKGSHKQTINYKRSKYQKFTGRVDLGDLQWKNDSYAKGTVSFDTSETEQYNLSTGWITEEESEWLQELAGSPAVFWQIDPANAKKIIAVTITEDNYEVKKYANKKLFNLNITMQLAQPNYRQRA